MTAPSLPSMTFPAHHAARFHGCRLRDAPFPYVVPVCRACADNALLAYWLSSCDKEGAIILMLCCPGCECTRQVRLNPVSVGSLAEST
jgi:formate dehydrogenase maturation protein FdhE